MATTRRRAFRIGSRSSDLALYQTRLVKALLSRAHPGIGFSIHTASTFGDTHQTQPLSLLVAPPATDAREGAPPTGGTAGRRQATSGVFTKDLERGLLCGTYDLVVHSLKDMPTVLPEGLALAAITERADPRDALVVRAEHRGCGGLAGLPPGCVIGTSSVRRCALVQYLYPGKFRVRPVRGNVNTRLRKLDASAGNSAGGGTRTAATACRGYEYDALILAAAGLRRLGLGHRIEAIVEFPYSAGQGALAVECRAADTRARDIARSAAHWSSTVRCSAERALLRTLSGGCQVPVGVTSSLGRGAAAAAATLALTGIVVAPNGGECTEAAGTKAILVPHGGEAGCGADLHAAVAAGEALGIEVATKLRAGGAQVFIMAGDGALSGGGGGGGGGHQQQRSRHAYSTVCVDPRHQ